MSIRGPLLFTTGFAVALAAGWIGLPAALYEVQEQLFQFNHAAHKAKASMDCADCHAFGDNGRYAGVPKLDNCAMCHEQAVGETAIEKAFVEQFVTPKRELDWHVYSRQPMNVRFPHAIHVKSAKKLTCEDCHGDHGTTDKLRPYQQNRISGYSRDIWGGNIARIGLKAGEGMKMSDCESCHAEHAVEAGCLGCHK